MASKPERLLLRVVKGGFEAADGYTLSRLKAKGYHTNDVVLAQLTKPRNPKFHRMAHSFAKLLAENIEEFESIDPHSILKRIQYEANIACDEMGAKVPGVGFVMIRIPQSLSFASMDQGRFEEVYRAMCRHIAKSYWKDMSEQQVAEMVEIMPND